MAKLLYSIALIASLALVIWLMADALSWRRYKAEHHCIQVGEARRSAMPWVAPAEIWDCEGRRVERQ